MISGYSHSGLSGRFHIRRTNQALDISTGTAGTFFPVLIVLGDGLHEVEPVEALPALEYMGGHGDGSCGATAEIVT